MIKVVVIEDEELLRKGLIYTFPWQQHGFIVIDEAENGAQGRKVIQQTTPDVIITDIKMPIMDGLKMLQSIENRTFETIVMTGFAEFEYAQKAIELGVSHFILKPIDERKLKDILVKVKQSIENKQQVEHFKQTINKTSTIDLFEGRQSLVLSASNHRMVEKALNYIHSNYHQKISLDSLSEALEMSPGYVSRTFKKVTSFNVNEYINRFRVQQSIDLLLQDKYKLYEIALMCGFKDYKYFYHVFMQYVHTSPKEFITSNYVMNKNDK